MLLLRGRKLKWNSSQCTNGNISNVHSAEEIEYNRIMRYSKTKVVADPLNIVGSLARMKDLRFWPDHVACGPVKRLWLGMDPSHNLY